jgi:hypothetical protein
VQDILGAGEIITLDNYMDQRPSAVAFHVAGHALRSRFRDEASSLKPFLFPQLLKATREWLDTQLTCTRGTKPGLFLWKGLADEAALLIYNACVSGGLAQSADDEPGGAVGRAALLPVMDPYNPAIEPLRRSAHVEGPAPDDPGRSLPHQPRGRRQRLGARLLRDD